MLAQSPTEPLLTDTEESSRFCLDGAATLLIPAVLFAQADAGSATSIGTARPMGQARFSTTATRPGVRIAWAATTGSLEAIVVDINGKRLADFQSSAPTGSKEIALPGVRGKLFVRLRDGRESRTFALPRF